MTYGPQPRVGICQPHKGRIAQETGRGTKESKVARRIAYAVCLPAGYRLAFWHHDDPLAQLVTTPAFRTLLFAGTIMIAIYVIARIVS
jgi:hypothetical protein